MKIGAKLVGMVAFMIFMVMALSAQKPADMVGTWSGIAALDVTSEPNTLTLILELKEGKLAGHMTDQYGTMSQAPAVDITLDKDTFSFSV